jgi:hypothetical protein
MKSTMLLATAAATIVGAGVGFAGSELDERAYAPIDRAELEFERSRNAYDAIVTLRADWLAEGKGKRELPTVFIEMRCTGPTCLQWVQSDQLEEIRFLKANQSASEWPHANPNGSIVVTLRPRLPVTPGVERR